MDLQRQGSKAHTQPPAGESADARFYTVPTLYRWTPDAVEKRHFDAEWDEARLAMRIVYLILLLNGISNNAKSEQVRFPKCVNYLVSRRDASGNCQEGLKDFYAQSVNFLK